MPQRRKRSAAITLVLAGSLGGCSEPVPQRDVYTSLADCQRDWAPEGRVGAGVVLGAVSLAAGILNAACMTY